MENQKENELILVTKASTFSEIGSFQGFTNNVEPYMRSFFDQDQVFFTKRGPAEENPDLKQIIPYCIIKQNEKLLFYRRGSSGGEKRLQDLWSCGIGGHINPIDFESNGETKNSSCFNRESLAKALLRELQEELTLPQNQGEISFKTIGLINDDSDAVGQVHLGLVQLATIPEGEISSNEDAIEEVTLLSLKEAHKFEHPLEKWSKIALENIH